MQSSYFLKAKRFQRNWKAIAWLTAFFLKYKIFIFDSFCIILSRDRIFHFGPWAFFLVTTMILDLRISERKKKILIMARHVKFALLSLPPISTTFCFSKVGIHLECTWGPFYKGAIIITLQWFKLVCNKALHTMSHHIFSQWAATIMHERSVPLQNTVQSAGKWTWAILNTLSVQIKGKKDRKWECGNICCNKFLQVLQFS